VDEGCIIGAFFTDCLNSGVLQGELSGILDAYFPKEELFETFCPSTLKPTQSIFLHL
jgi:hypothetical protein